MSCVVAVLSTLAAWFAGLMLDANIGDANMMGFLCLRVVLPIIVMGVCVIKSNRDK